MARWQNDYQPGDRVEVRSPLMNKWLSGTVLRAKHDVRVKVDHGKYDWVVTRKGEIRRAH